MIETFNFRSTRAVTAVVLKEEPESVLKGRGGEGEEGGRFPWHRTAPGKGHTEMAPGQGGKGRRGLRVMAHNWLGAS